MEGMIGAELLSERQFERVAKIVYQRAGIELTAPKRRMVSARLAKRARHLGLGSFEEYFEFAQEAANWSDEIEHIVDAITTNKTDFFREPHHFDYIVKHVLPEMERVRPISPQNPIQCWSAACSSGEEPYTMAMVLAEYFGGRLDCFSVLATDIARHALRAARRAVYEDGPVATIPRVYRDKYMMCGKGDMHNKWRVAPKLRDRVTFGRLNLMDRDYGIGIRMHFIFCRNVMIYFDAETRSTLVEKLRRMLVPNGHLFIGHSETLMGVNDKFKAVAPTVYLSI